MSVHSALFHGAAALVGALLSVGCGGKFGGEVTGADLVRSRGTPVAFTMECLLRHLDPATQSWVQSDAVTRVDLWMYDVPDGHDHYVIVNGIIVDAGRGETSLDGLRNPGIDPRRFGCFEEVDTVADVLRLGDPDVTTVGSAQEASLLTTADGTRLQGDYYGHKKGGGILILSVDGAQVIGMVTL